MGPASSARKLGKEDDAAEFERKKRASEALEKYAKEYTQHQSLQREIRQKRKAELGAAAIGRVPNKPAEPPPGSSLAARSTKKYPAVDIPDSRGQVRKTPSWPRSWANFSIL